MFQNLKIVLNRAFDFTGRSDRFEFWSFVLFLFLSSIALLVVNSVIFGPTKTAEFKVTLDSSGNQTQELIEQVHYGSGWLGIAFAVMMAIPLLSCAMRRLHDIHRPGWFVLIPVAGYFLAQLLLWFTSTPRAIDTAKIPAEVDFPQEFMVPNAIGFLISGVIAFGSFIFLVVLLSKRSQPGPNKYGPNPTEVTK